MGMDNLDVRRGSGLNIGEEKGVIRGGRGGTCETSLSVLIFPAERETDRKSIASYFSLI